MHGTRDAAQGWEGAYRGALEKLGFARGASSPCVFTHTSLNIRLAVHGDDFFATGVPADLVWFERELLKTFEGKVKGRLAEPGDELRILNRVVRRTSDGYEWEADQRHAELLIRESGLNETSRPLTNPGRKLTRKEEDEEEFDLSLARASSYRQQVARANFLAVDRPDISFSVKELCRHMAAPTNKNEEALKRLARYLLGCPRLVVHFQWQTPMKALLVMTDSDWAGCTRTRKSTSGGVVMRGRHLIKHWSGT